MALFYWTVDVHNLVNQKLNKPQISYDDAYKMWFGIPCYKKMVCEEEDDCEDDCVKDVVVNVYDELKKGKKNAFAFNY